MEQHGATQAARVRGSFSNFIQRSLDPRGVVTLRLRRKRHRDGDLRQPHAAAAISGAGEIGNPVAALIGAVDEAAVGAGVGPGAGGRLSARRGGEGQAEET